MSFLLKITLSLPNRTLILTRCVSVHAVGQCSASQSIKQTGVKLAKPGIAAKLLELSHDSLEANLIAGLIFNDAKTKRNVSNG